jgi:hypothetical protein
MLTVPADPAGAVAVICVALFTVKLVAGTAPKSTAVTPLKSVPVMVTELPPARKPLAGETAVTATLAVTVKLIGIVWLSKVTVTVPLPVEEGVRVAAPTPAVSNVPVVSAGLAVTPVTLKV